MTESPTDVTLLPPDDPDAIATLADLRCLRAKRDEVTAELVRLSAASQPVVRFSTH